jgi:hypothetical protein
MVFCLAVRPSSRRIASKIHTIIAAVAALEIHMDKKAVGVMNPSIMREGLVPAKSKAFRATLLWRPDSSTARAIIKLPKYIIWVPCRQNVKKMYRAEEL